MGKMILIPYDKYKRLLSGQVRQPKLVNTTDSDAEQDKTDSLQRDNHQSIAQDSTTDDLLPSLPLPLRSRGKTIINHLKKHSDFRWNDKGEIIVDGQLVKGSNIIDLILKNSVKRLQIISSHWCGSFQSTCSRKQCTTECAVTTQTLSNWHWKNTTSAWKTSL